MNDDRRISLPQVLERSKCVWEPSCSTNSCQHAVLPVEGVKRAFQHTPVERTLSVKSKASGQERVHLHIHGLPGYGILEGELQAMCMTLHTLH